MKVKLFVYVLFMGFCCFGQPSNYDESSTYKIGDEVIFDTLKNDVIKDHIRKIRPSSPTGYYVKVIEKYDYSTNKTVYVSDFTKVRFDGNVPNAYTAYELTGSYFVLGNGYSKSGDYDDPNTKETIGVRYYQHSGDYGTLLQSESTGEKIILFNETFLSTQKNIDSYVEFEKVLNANGIEIESDYSFTYNGKNLKINEYSDEIIAGNFNFYKTGSKGYETNLAKLKAGLDAFEPYYKKLVAHEKLYRVKGSNMPMSELNAWKATCQKAVPIFRKLDSTFQSVNNSNYYTSKQTTTSRYVNVMEFVSNCGNMF